MYLALYDRDKYRVVVKRRVRKKGIQKVVRYRTFRSLLDKKKRDFNV